MSTDFSRACGMAVDYISLDAMKAMALAPVAEAEVVEEEDLESPETLALPQAQSVSDLNALDGGQTNATAATAPPPPYQPPPQQQQQQHHPGSTWHVSQQSASPPVAPAQQLRVTVPWGVYPGQLINVKAPNGHALQCTVPAGLQPGQQMLVNMATGAPPPLTTVVPPVMQQMHQPVVHQIPMARPLGQHQAWGV